VALDFNGTRPFAYGTKDEHQAHINAQLQSVNDMVKEIENISLRITKTNMETMVTLTLGETKVTKSIAAWILRRRELARIQSTTYQMLGKNESRVQPQNYTKSGHEPTDDNPIQVANPLKFFNRKERDDKVALYADEPIEINSKLEVVNATTSLLQLSENLTVD